MKKCWESDSADRPTFSELVTSIDQQVEYLTGYVNLSELIVATNTPETYTAKQGDIHSKDTVLYSNPGNVPW